MISGSHSILKELLTYEFCVRNPSSDPAQVDIAYQRITEITAALRDRSRNSRKFQRIPVPFAILIEVAPGKELECQGSDLSLGGFRLLDHPEFPDGEYRLVRLTLNGRHYELNARGRVFANPPQQHRGVEFRASDPAARHALFDAFDHAYMSYLQSLVEGVKGVS